jgi:hypothetical protein
MLFVLSVIGTPYLLGCTILILRFRHLIPNWNIWLPLVCVLGLAVASAVVQSATFGYLMLALNDILHEPPPWVALTILAIPGFLASIAATVVVSMVAPRLSRRAA